MPLVRYIEKLRRLDSLIRKKATGNQKEFCKKVEMSRSLLNHYISEMKELGFPIEYDKFRQTYYYKEEGKLVSNFFQRSLNNDEIKHYNGGYCPPTEIFIQSNYIGLEYQNFDMY